MGLSRCIDQLSSSFKRMEKASLEDSNLAFKAEDPDTCLMHNPVKFVGRHFSRAFQSEPGEQSSRGPTQVFKLFSVDVEIDDSTTALLQRFDAIVRRELDDAAEALSRASSLKQGRLWVRFIHTSGYIYFERGGPQQTSTSEFVLRE